MKSLSRVQLFVTPRTVAHQAPPSMGFSRQHYWSGVPFPSPGDLPNPGIEPGSPALEADALTSEPPGKTELGSASALFKISHRAPTLPEEYVSPLKGEGAGDQKGAGREPLY